MKVLYPLITLSLLCSAALAEESLEAYISQNKKEQFKYDYDKVDAQSSKLRDSWIAPLNLQYSYSKSNPYDEEQTTENAAVKMDQPIFASGGIYYGIKFAEASRIYSNFSVEAAQRKLVKDAISLLMQIKQMDFKIKKQELQIKNSEINLAQKQEQYLNGQLDSGFLDNAIIERNVVTQTLYDIQTNKERLISKFNAISDMAYESAEVPSLDSLTKEQFLANNIVLDMSKSDIEKNRYNKDVTTTKYLPRVSLIAGYNWNKSDTTYRFGSDNERDYYDYGLKVSMPLDINSFRDIEASRIDYLKSQLVVEDRRRELKALFEEVAQNIENFEKKIDLSIQNRELYEKLLFETQEMYSAGYKTSYDVDLLKNSVIIQTIDLKIFEIDKQLELLTLYEMYKK
ncbi:MAG: TolC family protein [Sulfurimonas sp.]|jgi:outer membrane protein TolC|nr:TolC family protein [Sulfurimonas sp.]